MASARSSVARRPASLTGKSSKRKWGQTSRKSRHERGYGWEWEKTRERILKRDRRLCQHCLPKGRVVVATDVDHIVPRALGGSEADSNLQSLCGDCHKAKTAREGQSLRFE